MRRNWYGNSIQFAWIILLGFLSGSVWGSPPENAVAPNTHNSSLLPGLALPALGESYNAAADFAKSWDVKKNPYGAWRYGWSDGLYGTFVLFPYASILPYHNRQQAGWNDPSVDYGYTPSVRLNFGGDYDDGNVAYRAGAFILHGGGKGGNDFAHAIWTAPTSGRYSVYVVFEAQQYGINADAHILVSTTAAALPDAPLVIHLPGEPAQKGKVVSCYDTVLTQNRMTGNFTGNFTLAEGDTIDFAVGQNNTKPQHPGCVALNAVIQKQ